MKLKTRFQDEDFEIGEVVDVDIATMPDGRIKLQGVAKAGGFHTIFYDKIEKLYDDWEDYEEPKQWYGLNAIRDVGFEPLEYEGFEDLFKHAKELGIGFETKEDAEKAVEKLKAWQRLEDKITAIDRASFDGVGTATLFVRYKSKDHEEVQGLLALLFGGEE